MLGCSDGGSGKRLVGSVFGGFIERHDSDFDDPHLCAVTIPKSGSRVTVAMTRPPRRSEQQLPRRIAVADLLAGAVAALAVALVGPQVT
ncbi:hypothetical protein GCM10010319_34110 [Streptomyces blastmyceticus]|uniref:Uncharacterized protein n=1 Tax=Streptomyces blastmyceticus TaxID=68180 RepID=A0ABP3GT20_9ACTN